MARLANALLGQAAFNAGRSAPTLDPTLGSQNGFEVDYPSWVSNAQYIRRNLICKLIEAPAGFQYLPNPDVYVNTLKALVELKALRIEGLNQTLTVETQGTPFGGAGEQQEDPTKVTRAQSNPSFTWNEKFGKPISYFLRDWVTELIMDPITGFPNVVTRTGAQPTDNLPDFYSATMLFVEPDPLHKNVLEAWLCTNMYPKGSLGDIVGRRDQTAPGEQAEYSIEFTAITQVGIGVMQLAQQMLDQMNLTGANPNLRPAFVQQIDADVMAAANGYAEQIANAAASAISV